MTATEELQKAIKLVERAADILQKSQMAFDFNVGTPHHVAYTRTNASGTVSNIAAKGVPREKAIKTFRAGYMRAKIDHDNRQHGEQSSPHYRAGREAGSESTAATDHRAAYRAHLAKHPRQNTQTGEWEPMMSSVKGEGEFADGFHASLEEKKRDAHYDAGYKTGQKHIEAGIHQEIGGTWGDAWEKHAAKHYPASQPAEKQKVWGGTDSSDGKFRFRDWETGDEVPNYEGEYTYFSKDGGKSQMHTWMDKYGERNHSHMTKDEYNAKYGEDFGRTPPHKVGDNVHLGFGTKGGAGYYGKLTKIDGETAYVTNDEGRTFKGHVSKLSAGGTTAEPPSSQKPSKVYVDTSSHFRSHLKEPKGRGGWMFSKHKDIDFGTHKQGEDWISTPSMTYADAKKHAKEWAASKGHSTIYVMP